MNKKQAGDTQTGLILVVVVLIGIVGWLILQNSQSQPNTLSQEKNSSLPSFTPQPKESDQTSNWKRYTDSNMGVAFNYPREYDASLAGPGPHPDSIDTIHISNNDTDAIEYVFYAYSIGSAQLDDWVQANLGELFPLEMTKVSTTQPYGVILHQYKYLEASSSTPQSILFIFFNQNKAYVLQISNTSDSKEAIVNQILSTLEFIE